VKAFASEKYEKKRFEQESLASVELTLKAKALKAGLSPAVDVIVAAGSAAVLWYGARLALAGTITPGSLIVFLVYLGKLYSPIRGLSKLPDNFSKPAIAFERIQEVMDVEVKDPERTCIAVFADKEEIGSVSNTGLDTLYLENLIANLAPRMGIENYAAVRQALMNSHALSADVNAAVDPSYEDVFEKKNDSFLGKGVVVTKYTGSKGKSESNDANPEFVAAIRRIFNQNQVAWQVGELGKVDIGGGGTVAMFLSRYGMEVLDCGVAILGMHSPYEVSSKIDIYHAYKGYRAFYMEMTE
jgi:ABC-type multidrug transport system fused ATPase/permease subunit